jgi:hypothetical protein
MKHYGWEMDKIKSFENKYRCPIISVGATSLVLSGCGSNFKWFSQSVNLALFIVALVIIVPYWLVGVYYIFKASCKRSEEPYQRKPVAPVNPYSTGTGDVKLNFKNLRY